MTDTEKLKEIIENSGLRASYIIDKLGICNVSFYNKVNNKGSFRIEEVVKLCEILHIDSQTRDAIFFNH